MLFLQLPLLLALLPGADSEDGKSSGNCPVGCKKGGNFSNEELTELETLFRTFFINFALTFHNRIIQWQLKCKFRFFSGDWGYEAIAAPWAGSSWHDGALLLLAGLAFWARKRRTLCPTRQLSSPFGMRSPAAQDSDVAKHSP
ncbi:hypothetical protein Cadr_000024616 [Camelus dromedarius]|uniref:Uncharacterized protein n=1 Tax=Camelus dromedarius TaxID=9838 RepID=A0A5N4CPU8_CAMDR|nr:hypothetical protein Cadr_000024616 [Camelus dromedarius]